MQRTLFAATTLAGALAGSAMAQAPDAGCALPSEPEASLSLVSEIFLEPMVRIRFIIERLHLDEPSSIVEMLCFRERAVSLQSQDHHSP